MKMKQALYLVIIALCAVSCEKRAESESNTIVDEVALNAMNDDLATVDPRENHLPNHGDLINLKKGNYLIYSVPLELLAEKWITIYDLLENKSFGIYRGRGEMNKHQQLFDEIEALQKIDSSSSPEIVDHICLLVWRNSSDDLCHVSIGSGWGPFQGALISDSQQIAVPKKLMPQIFDLLPEEDRKGWKFVIKGHLD